MAFNDRHDCDRLEISMLTFSGRGGTYQDLPFLLRARNNQDMHTAAGSRLIRYRADAESAVTTIGSWHIKLLSNLTMIPTLSRSASRPRRYRASRYVGQLSCRIAMEGRYLCFQLPIATFPAILLCLCPFQAFLLLSVQRIAPTKPA